MPAMPWWALPQSASECTDDVTLPKQPLCRESAKIVNQQKLHNNLWQLSQKTLAHQTLAHQTLVYQTLAHYENIVNVKSRKN